MKQLLLAGLLIMMNSQAQFNLSSLDFLPQGSIPKEFTGYGANKAPKLAWEYAPKNTKSFALIVDDPDAPGQKDPWVHWVVYNLPGNQESLDISLGRSKKLANGIMQGINSDNNIGYDGPKPPDTKAHRYFFKLYALDTKLSLAPGATKEQLLAAIKGHILAQAELVGTYKKP